MVLTQKDLEGAIANMQESIGNQLATQTSSLKTHMDESISAIRKEIIGTLQVENQKLKDEITTLQSRNSYLEERVNSLEVKVEVNFQYQRNSSIVIAGIPNEVEHNKLENIVLNIFNKVCFHDINHRDIIACHRLSLKSDNIVVKFVNKKDAIALLGSRIALKELDTSEISQHCKNIYVNEHLTPYMSELAYKCRCLKRSNKIYQTKVEKGVVKILTNKDGSFRWFNINCESDIYQFDQVNNIETNTEGGD